MPDSQERQLELFPVASRQKSERPHRELLGRLVMQLRYDQCVLAGIAVLIGATVVFAFGVERGKRLARTGPTQLARQQMAPSGTPDGIVDSSTRERPPSAARTPEAEPRDASSPAVTPSRTVPAKSAGTKKRYAVQVITFSRVRLAKQELERLKAKGESAFLVAHADGRTTVCVGPFLSKAPAAKKVAMLRDRYQDCFIKTL